jgi:hypothetical protein
MAAKQQRVHFIGSPPNLNLNPNPAPPFEIMIKIRIKIKKTGPQKVKCAPQQSRRQPLRAACLKPDSVLVRGDRLFDCPGGHL